MYYIRISRARPWRYFLPRRNTGSRVHLSHGPRRVSGLRVVRGSGVLFARPARPARLGPVLLRESDVRGARFLGDGLSLDARTTRAPDILDLLDGGPRPFPESELLFAHLVSRRTQLQSLSPITHTSRSIPVGVHRRACGRRGIHPSNPRVRRGSRRSRPATFRLARGRGVSAQLGAFGHENASHGTSGLPEFGVEESDLAHLERLRVSRGWRDANGGDAAGCFGGDGRGNGHRHGSGCSGVHGVAPGPESGGLIGLSLSGFGGASPPLTSAAFRGGASV